MSHTSHLSVSVVIPAHNVAEFITSAIDSVLNQAYPATEIIVVDDGSTDSTKNILAKYIEAKKIVYLYQEQRGPGAARNAGVKVAKGELVAFLDADDTWLSDKLQKQTLLFKDSDVALVYSDLDFVGEDFKFRRYSDMAGGFYRGEVVDRLVKTNFIPTSSVIVRKSAFVNVGGFAEDYVRLPVGEDYELWLKIANQFKVDFCSDVLVHYRVHKAQISKERETSYRSLATLYKRLMADKQFAAHKNVLLKKYVENKSKLLHTKIFSR